MKKLVYYSKDTGEILGVSIFEEEDPRYIQILEEEGHLDASNLQFEVQHIGSYRVVSGALMYVGPKPGDFYQWNASTLSWEKDALSAWSYIRNTRDRKIQASDWTQLPDVPLATKEAWATYRQALRDVTNQPDPFNIIWPTPPN